MSKRNKRGLLERAINAWGFASALKSDNFITSLLGTILFGPSVMDDIDDTLSDGGIESNTNFWKDLRKHKRRKRRR